MNSRKILAAEGLGCQVSPKVIFSSWSACLFNDQLFFNMSSYPLSSYMPFTCLHFYLPLTKNARLALLSILSGRVSLLTVNKELFYTCSFQLVRSQRHMSVTALHGNKSGT